ncbi:MAG: glycosyltransferase [Bryobacterales bacterium]|nr:glycosyltransferase [Bryobacterales bacterium]
MTQKSSREAESRSESAQIERLKQSVDRLRVECERLEERLACVENSIIFRTLKRLGSAFETRKRMMGQLLLRSPLHPLYLRFWKAGVVDGYGRWVREQERRFPSREWHEKEAASWSSQPKISILMPVYNPIQQWLAEAIASVRNQSYNRWQLCICDDASSESWVREWVGREAAADERIKFAASGRRLGISGALNEAGKLATGDYVAFLDHDDVLHRFALHYVVEALQDGDVHVVYTDEDHLDGKDERVRPQFKPGWSPDLLTSCMYWGHLLTIRRDVLERVGWFRTECDGSQDHDLALRIADGPICVRHVPLVLYHWREHLNSTSVNSSAKPYTTAAAFRALTDTLRRRGVTGEPQLGPVANTYYINRKVASRPLISIVICSRDSSLLSRCLNAVQHSTRYDPWEIVTVWHRIAPSDFPEVLVQRGCRVVTYDGPFHFAQMNNHGARKANGSLLLFLNDDTEPLNSDWLDHVVAHLERPEVGVVGGKLLYPSGTIQHAGIAVGMMDGVGHPGRGLFRSELFPWLELTREVTAVTGACLGIRTALFQELGGFDESFPVNYNDVDLCLRVRERGLHVICEPRVLVRHYECASRTGGTSFRERWAFQERWRRLIECPDPYFPGVFDYGDEKIRLKM